MISIPLPAIIPKRNAAKRATAICASNIVIVLASTGLAIWASSEGIRRCSPRRSPGRRRPCRAGLPWLCKRRGTTVSGGTKGEASPTASVSPPHAAAPDWVREPSLNGLLELAGFRELCAQSPIAFATAPKSGFFWSGTRPAVDDSSATPGRGGVHDPSSRSTKRW
jgi:hypothetical protein